MATAGVIPRTVRAAVAAAISAAREAGRLQPWHEPAAAVALKTAAALGRAKLTTADHVRLSAELRKLLEDLPLAPATAGPEGGDRDDAGSPADRAGTRDTRPLGLAPGMGTGPTVGDTALPA